MIAGQNRSLISILFECGTVDRRILRHHFAIPEACLDQINGDDREAALSFPFGLSEAEKSKRTRLHKKCSLEATTMTSPLVLSGFSKMEHLPLQLEKLMCFAYLSCRSKADCIPV